jgi:hypothetical protein
MARMAPSCSEGEFRVFLHVNISDARPRVELRELHNFRQLSVRVDGTPNPNRLRAALVPYGHLGEDDHAYISVAALISLAGDTGREADWQNAFRDMIDYARTRGWVDQDDAVRAHIESTL